MIVFAKAPIPGRVKTRLAPAVGAAGTAGLHSAFVLDTLERLLGFKDFADIELHTDTPTDAWAEYEVARDVQAQGGLELKLLHALEHGLAQGRPQVTIFGSDSPTLPRAHVDRLLASRADVTLGPCEDGGYYAIACRRVHRNMFSGVIWSQPTVLKQTVSAAEASGLSVECGDLWYDVDGPEDLARLAAEPDLPRHTRNALRSARIGSIR